MRIIKNKYSIILLNVLLIFLLILTMLYQMRESYIEGNITVQSEPPLETIIVSSNNISDIENSQNMDKPYEEDIEEEDIEVFDTSEKETFITTMDMSHYTNEIGKHIPSSEGGAVDRKGNPLVVYESIAIPKSLYKHFPYGSTIKIVTPSGEVYYGKAVDTGGALNTLNRIDRCVASYQEAQSLGVIKNVKIYKVD